MPVFTKYPGEEDIKQWLSASGITPSTALQGQLKLLSLSAIDIFEGRIKRKILAGSASERRFDPPTNNNGVLLLENDLATFTSLKYQPYNTTEETWTVDQDFTLYPINAIADTVPYTRVYIHRLKWSEPLGSSFRRSIKINGQWGYQTNIPEDAWNAILLIGTMLAIMPYSAVSSGGLKRKKIEDFEVEYGAGQYFQQIQYWTSIVQRAIEKYRKI